MKGKKRKAAGFVPLLLIMSFFIVSCSGDEAETEESLPFSQPIVETSETVSPKPEETPEVEFLGLESADPYLELEPEDLPVEEDGYNGESMQNELDAENSEESTEETEETEPTPTPKPTATPEPVVTDPEVQTATPAPVSNSTDPMDRIIDFNMLQSKKNAHIYSWISVPGTNIDYPVLRHPTDDGYYLYHNLNGSQGYPGCIYTENCNSMEWTDPVTVLYGHDMRSTGTMFHQLHKFETQSFFDKHEYFYIYTPTKTMRFHIFSAFVNSNEHLIGSHNFYNKEEFDSFFGNVLATSNATSHVRAGVAIDSNSKIVALSTCIKNQPNNRYIIFGVLEE